MHIAIVTSGGDAPGTNSALRAVARCAIAKGVKVSGVVGSWQGVVDGRYLELSHEHLAGIVRTGGTILRSSRTPLLTADGDAEKIARLLKQHSIDAVVVIGGDGSHRGAAKLANTGFPVVAVPKTIDNDLGGTDLTIGFCTAVETATTAIDRIRTHTESNDRVMVIEVMGRNAGWIATYAGLASGADLILVPEFSWSLDTIASHLQQRHNERGRDFSLIVVAEGARNSAEDIQLADDRRVDHLGRSFLGGIGNHLATLIEDRVGFESRCTTLGYLLRGGAPIAEDRILATRLGAAAADTLLNGASDLSVAWRGGSVDFVPLSDVNQAHKVVDEATYRLAARFN